MRLTLLIGVLVGMALLAAPKAVAQTLGPIVTIPIEKVRETYSGTNETGTRKQCGVRLYGEWPVYLNYTNRTSYTIYTPGMAGIPSPQSSVPPGGRFRFSCCFSGIDTPNLDAICPTESGDSLPDWYVEIRRRGPQALFNIQPQPANPAQFQFTSVATDPDGDPIVSEQWNFGDGTSGSGVSPNHTYSLPGTFPVRLTVTDSDGLTNAGTGNLTVPAPKLTVSLRLFSKHENNRIEPGEVFLARVTVAASSDGLGDLTNIVFSGAALTVPTNLTVLEVPASTNIGTLQPGTEMVFEWVLRGDALGDFTLRTGSLNAKDAINRNVFAFGATALGSVTALLAGIEQQPKRVVLGEDNNEDGVVNAADALVKLILGITNVAAVPITELRTDNLAEPISLVTRLAGVPVALVPVSIFSGDLGSVQPGAANAVFRTNVYTATNYVYATASTIVRGKAEEVLVQTGASTAVEVRNPGVKITMHALEKSGLTEPSIALGTTDLDAPLVPVTASAVLNTQPEIGSGLIGDGVTPLLFKLEADTKALTVQDDPLKIRVQIQIKGTGNLGGASLQSRLRILKAGVWTASDTAEMTLTEPKVYAYLMPIASDEIEPPVGQGFLGAELTVLNDDSDTELEQLVFGLRKPPIALVHGYNTDGSWGAGALSIFKASRPDDPRAGPFVHVIRYGQAVDGSALAQRLQGVSVNTTWPLEDLVFQVHEQFRNAMNPMKTEWAFTRHDVVAHSQGGLLTRMLCAANPNHKMRQAFRNEENFNRGWFHRVVTVGSPHNGTRILRYMLTMDEAGIPFGLFMPRLVSEALVFKRVAQKKFDPWGPQIVNLNNQHPHAPWYPDAGARFHLVRTTVNDGQPPTSLHATVADFFLGLNFEAFGFQVVPRGSDGVVDFDSMAASGPNAAVPANVFTLSGAVNVSHATTAIGPWDDIFGGDHGGQVNSIAVANHAIGALDQVGIPDQHRVFGTIRPPPPLSFAIRDAIDAAALAQNNLFNGSELATIGSTNATGPRPEVTAASDDPRTFELNLTPYSTRPVGSRGVFWFAEVFGTNGVSTEGLTLVPDATNPTHATLTVSDGVLGDVVAYAFYPAANGGTVYSMPLRLASFEPSSPAVELRVLPQGSSLPVGDVAPIQLLVRHENGLWLQRHVKPDEITVASRTPLTVNVDDPLAWRCVSSGKAVVTAIWRGLTNEAEVTVFGSLQTPAPIPEPLVWLRADAGLSLTNGTNVISWTDQSPNNFVFTAPTVATRPTWVSNASAGVPAIRFTGTAVPRLQGNLGRTLSNATIFTVCRFTSTSGSRYAYAFGTINFSGLMMTLARQSGDGAAHYDGAVARVADNTIPGTDFRVFSQVYSEGGPDRHRMAVNAKTVLNTRTTTGRAYSAIATDAVLGNYAIPLSSYRMDGDIVEWLVYDRVLSAEERLQVEEYLRQRAGLAPFFTPGSLDLAAGSRVDYEASDLPAAAWTPDLGNRSVTLPAAADPAFLLAPEGPVGTVIQARLRSNGTNGFIGFVLGWQDAGNFLLFDWNRTATNHPVFGSAAVGMRLRSFHIPGGEPPTGVDFWSSPKADRVTPIISAATPWSPGVDYDLTIWTLPDRLQLLVQQGTNTVVSWSLPQLPDVKGRFGFYAFDASGANLGQLILPDAPLFVTSLEREDNSEITLRWMNGQPPYVIEASTSLQPGEWFEIAPPTPNQSQRISITDNPLFLRVRGSGN